jgi:predicted amidophosphoribosyltransferase
MPIKIAGNWKSGLAYDVHLLDSVYLGPDEFGHARFDNTRSEMGDLVYQLKYRLEIKALRKIVYLLDDIKGIEAFDCIIPMAASNQNRPYQPVTEIAKALGERRGVKVLDGALLKTGVTPQLKNVSDPEERKKMLVATMSLSQGVDLSNQKVLIIDDLYRSGDSLRAATQLLLDGGATQVSVLTMTKTRNG